VVDLREADGALHRLWVSWCPRVDGEGQAYPSLKFLPLQLSFDEAAARERPDLWPAQEQR
jgi:hypothetical protein